MTEKTGKKLSHQAKGLLLFFAAIPIIVVIKYYYEDQVALGALASLLLALGAIEIGKQDTDG